MSAHFRREFRTAPAPDLGPAGPHLCEAHCRADPPEAPKAAPFIGGAASGPPHPQTVPSSEDAVRDVAARLGATEIEGGLYATRCSEETPSLSFTIGGRTYSLDRDDLVVQRSGDACLLGLMGTASDSRWPMWILGSVFMRKYYVQFDWGQKRLGFAPARRAGDNFV